ncbi:MAG: hypothetical protein ACI8TL_001060 [Natronomonas sp.]|jgi:hypothetical protein
MARSVKDVLLSWGLVFVAGAVLWPPRAVYWEVVAATVGETLTLAFVALVAVGFGAAAVGGTRIQVQSFVAGGLLAYGSGMVAIEVAVSPASPVHLIWYGVLLGCFVGGALLWEGAVGFGPAKHNPLRHG